MSTYTEGFDVFTNVIIEYVCCCIISVMSVLFFIFFY